MDIKRLKGDMAFIAFALAPIMTATVFISMKWRSVTVAGGVVMWMLIEKRFGERFHAIPFKRRTAWFAMLIISSLTMGTRLAPLFMAIFFTTLAYGIFAILFAKEKITDRPQ